MNRTTRTISLFASAAIVVCSLYLLQGCKKDTSAPGKTDSTGQQPTATSSGTDTATKAEPATAAQPAAISGKALDGQKIFYNAAFGKVKVSCSSCHSDGQPTTKDTRIRPGHTLVGVMSRTATWNGMFKGADLKKYAYGAALCAAAYQKRAENADQNKSLKPDEAEALMAYFEAIATAPGAMTSNLTIQWATKPAFHEADKLDDKAAKEGAKAILKLPGDVTSGQAFFGRTCQYCHALTEKKVGPPLKDALKEIDYGAKVLRSGSDAMPFYGRDLLTDQQCADILAYIQQQLGR